MLRDNVQSFEAAKTLVENSQDLNQANIQVQDAQRPQNVFRVVLDLSKERSEHDPFPIGKYFKSVLFETSTDQKAEIFMRPISKSQEQDYFALRYRDSWAVSTVVATAFLHWNAQPGAKVTLVFFSDAEFRSGSQMSITSGGISISEGSSYRQLAPITLVPGVATKILDQNFFRKLALVSNKTSGEIWLGGPDVSNTGTNEGHSYSSSETVRWRNTSELWAYSPAGGKIVLSEQE